MVGYSLLNLSHGGYSSLFSSWWVFLPVLLMVGYSLRFTLVGIP